MGKGSFGESRLVGREEILGFGGGWPPLIDEPESSVGGDTVRVSQPGWRAYSPSPQDESSRSRKSVKKYKSVKIQKYPFLGYLFKSPPRLSMAIDRR